VGTRRRGGWVGVHLGDPIRYRVIHKGAFAQRVDHALQQPFGGPLLGGDEPEWHGARIPGAIHIPLDQLTARYQELDPDQETLVICGHGVRSAAAGQWLSQADFENIGNIRYGMSGWPGPVEP
jgi:rhodanese-related sulfurtransferase